MAGYVYYPFRPRPSPHLSIFLSFPLAFSSVQWPSFPSRSHLLLVLSLSLATKLRPDSKNSVKCHGVSPTGKMQPSLPFRGSSGTGIRMFSPLPLSAVEASTGQLFTRHRRYCS